MQFVDGLRTLWTRRRKRRRKLIFELLHDIEFKFCLLQLFLALARDVFDGDQLISFVLCSGVDDTEAAFPQFLIEREGGLLNLQLPRGSLGRELLSRAASAKRRDLCLS